MPLPEGFEDLHTSREIVEALVELRARRPGIKRAVLKLDESFSGEGNALFRYPASDSTAALAEALRQVEFAVATETSETYFDKFAKMGGIVEEFIEADEKHSPSAQLRIGPRGDVLPISTHDQILGGPSGQVFLGCRFPARDDYRLGIQEAGEQGRPPALRARRREPLRRGLPRPSGRARPALEDDRARDQPAHGRHDPPLPRAPVPHGRRASTRRPGSSSLRAARRSTTRRPTTSTPTATGACCRRTSSTC